MSIKANKTVIGIFVIGATALIITGVLVFGSGKFMKETDSYVLNFQGSVKGLRVGSPVMFRGVKIGSVTDILLRYNPDDMSVYIPVVIDVDPDKFAIVSGESQKKGNINLLVERGLKAQLQLQSMVTGQLMVNFDFLLDEPLKLTGIKSAYLELPTISSDMEKLSKTLENIPFEELMEKLSHSIEGLDRVLNSPELISSFQVAEQALKEIQKLIKGFNRHVEPLASNIASTSDAARSAFVQAEKTLSMKDGIPGEMASGIKEILASSRDTMKQAEQTLSVIEGFASEDSNLSYQLHNTLTELSSAARSVRFLADYIERHPESLIRGKGGSEGE